MADDRWQMSESMSQRNYRRLVVWQKGKALAIELAMTTKLLDQATEVGRLLNGLIKSLKPDNRIKESSRPSYNCDQASSEDYSIV